MLPNDAFSRKYSISAGCALLDWSLAPKTVANPRHLMGSEFCLRSGGGDSEADFMKMHDFGLHCKLQESWSLTSKMSTKFS